MNIIVIALCYFLGFICNSCRKLLNSLSYRYQCAECNSFDLCDTCYSAEKELEKHLKSHEMHVFPPLPDNHVMDGKYHSF